MPFRSDSDGEYEKLRPLLFSAQPFGMLDSASLLRSKIIRKGTPYDTAVCSYGVMEPGSELYPRPVSSAMYRFARSSTAYIVSSNWL